MTRTMSVGRPASRSTEVDSGLGFALAAGAVAMASAILAGWAPLGCSIVAVFLFAGPHNWMEARYFLGRLPARWGKLRPFFLVGFGGVIGLSASLAGLPVLASRWDWGGGAWSLAAAAWNTAFVLWVAALVGMRAGQNPRRDWSAAIPLTFLALAAAWIAPPLWGLALVYLHPLMAFWIFDRELLRSRPGWRRGYHLVLAVVPAMLGLLWWHLASAPPLPGTDALTLRVVRHAGSGYLPGISSRVLVATHVFLELLHYGVWIAAVPLVGLRAAPRQTGAIPLARRSASWRRGLNMGLIAGLGIVLVLWGGFLTDYPTTRDVYFTVATLHVLAEVPFLLRAL